jgi:hypothetical protein
MRLLNKKEMRRLPGSFACEFVLSTYECNPFLIFCNTHNILYEFTELDNTQHGYTIVCTGAELMMLILSMKESA